MIRIGIDNRLLHYRAGGIANYIRRVIEALAQLDPTSDYVILHSRKGTETVVPGPNFRRVNLWTPSHHRLEPWTLGVELARLRLDVLHCPDFIPPQWGARHYVITVHDLNFLHYPQFLTAESRRYYNNQIKRAVTQADHILADSMATRNDLVTMLDVPSEKITVHMLGVDETFHPLPDEAVAAACTTMNLTPGYVLFVGTFEPRKNITGLLDAYRLLRDRLPDAPPLILAGRRGWLYDQIFSRVNELGLTDHVLWRERIPQMLLPALYNGAAMLVAPSLYEGFGLTPLEAMACGTPTVVADRSSLPEVTADAGLLVNPDDPGDISAAIERLLVDSNLARRLSNAGIQRARQFTWQQTARIVLETYRQVSR